MDDFTFVFHDASWFMRLEVASFLRALKRCILAFDSDTWSASLISVTLSSDWYLSQIAVNCSSDKSRLASPQKHFDFSSKVTNESGLSE